MISVKNLSKSFGRTLAVNDISFEVDRGEILGFLGPNGAGKTTTMRILTCFLPADQGEVTVAGHDVFQDSVFKSVWDVIRALKAHDFRLETELNRLRGLTALGPINERDFREATHLRMIGVNDLMIAAIALAADLTLVSRNQDEFQRVAGLRLTSW